MRRNFVNMVLSVLLFFFICVLFAGTQSQAAKRKKIYVVGPKTAVEDDKYRDKDSYNDKTKQYYMLRSYIEKLGKEGGGMLVLKKGRYEIPCTLYVSSKITIRFRNGVRLVKTNKTGTKKLTAGKYLFQMVSRKKAKGKKKIAGYRASKNVNFSGSGKVTFDLDKVKEASGIYMGHAGNIKISGIRFQNKNGGSYIRIDGSKNVTVSNCRFYAGSAGDGLNNQMAIRMETINPVINGFGRDWSKQDDTVNKNIMIKNNNFYSPEVAVGSLKYVSKKKSGKRMVYYQKGVRITGNMISAPSERAIHAVGWDSPVISANTMKPAANTAKIYRYIWGQGVLDPVITKNSFSGCQYAVQFGTAKNAGAGSKYAKVKTQIADSCVDMLQSNTIANVDHFYISNDDKRIFYFRNKTDRNFTLNANSAPYHEYYTNEPKYSAKKIYYVFRSYMDQLEYAGGGTITVTAGTYNVTNNICIPSNVTVYLRSGVVFRKVGPTAADVCYARSVFTLLPPSKDGTAKTVSGYNGSQNVKMIGSRTVKIDCTNVLNAKAIVMGHTKNVTIRGITFLNEYGSHFIELNSSYNAVIENCVFQGFKPHEQKSYKECINVDGTDDNTGGFTFKWSAHDKTTCKYIYIRNNKFKNVGTAIGSHTYSASGSTQLYHENVQIYNNVVDGTYNSAVRALNWKNCIIRNNTFKNTQSLNDGRVSEGETAKYVTVFLRGVVNPTVTGNTFDKGDYYPIRVMQITEPSTDASRIAGYPNTISSLTDKNRADMKKNNLKNIPEKYHFIIYRTDDNEGDTEAAREEFAN